MKIGGTDVTKIDVRHGIEGPKHDPYSFTEITYEKGNRKVVIHQGLAEWIKVNGQKIDLQIGEDEIEMITQRETGYTPEELEKFWMNMKYPTKCRKCGCRRLKDAGGHIGESFTICTQCNEVIAYYFNHYAIQ